MSAILAEKLLNFFHFVLLGSFYLLEDWITQLMMKPIELGDHSKEIAVITGGHRGIGEFVSRDLLRAGMHLLMGCRRVEDGEKFERKAREEGITTGKVTILPLDLTSLSSVRSFSKDVLKETSHINLLINNAGIIPSQFKLTEDGFESSWQVNYLSHFLLTHLLMPSLQATPGSVRIVNVSSLAHVPARTVMYKDWNDKNGFDGWTAYMRSKLAPLMFTYYLNDKLNSVDSKVQVVAAHPGMVDTGILDDTIFALFKSLVYKSPKQGAKTIVHAALYGKGGEYLANSSSKSTSSFSKDSNQQQNLFEESKRLLKINSFGNLF